MELLAGIASILVMLLLAYPVYRKAKYAKVYSCLLPPGITSTNLAPIPMLAEEHFNTTWVLARGRTNWSEVIYYPKSSIKILSVHRLTSNLLQGLNMPTSELESFEVCVSRKGSEIVGDFVTLPLTPQGDVIFMGVPDESIQVLIGRLPSHLVPRQMKVKK